MKISLTELSITEIETFYKMILDHLNHLDGSILTLDFESVESVDLSVIQLLLSLKKYCDGVDITMNCINIQSEQFKQSITTYNLVEKLGVVL